MDIVILEVYVNCPTPSLKTQREQTYNKTIAQFPYGLS